MPNGFDFGLSDRNDHSNGFLFGFDSPLGLGPDEDDEAFLFGFDDVLESDEVVAAAMHEDPPAVHTGERRTGVWPSFEEEPPPRRNGGFLSVSLARKQQPGNRQFNPNIAEALGRRDSNEPTPDEIAAIFAIVGPELQRPAAVALARLVKRHQAEGLSPLEARIAALEELLDDPDAPVTAPEVEPLRIALQRQYDRLAGPTYEHPVGTDAESAPTVPEGATAEDGSWWQEFAGGVGDAWDWLTATAQKAEIVRLRETLDLTSEEAQDVARIRAQYSLQDEAALRVVRRRKKVLESYWRITTLAEAERYLALIEQGVARGLSRGTAEQEAVALMWPEVTKRSSVDPAPGTRRPPPKREAVDHGTPEPGAEKEPIATFRDLPTSLEVVEGIDHLTLLECPPPPYEVEYARKYINPAEVQDLKRLLLDKQRGLLRKIDAAIERTRGVATLVEETKPLVEDAWNVLQQLHTERRDARLLYGPVDVRSGRQAKELRLHRAVQGYGAKSELSAAEGARYLEDLETLYNEYQDHFSRLWSSVRPFGHARIVDRKRIGARLKLERPFVEDLAPLIQSLGERGETISRLRNEVCCVHARLGFSRLVLAACEAAETAMLAVERMEQTEASTFPVSFTRAGQLIADWLGYDDELEEVTEILTNAAVEARPEANLFCNRASLREYYADLERRSQRVDGHRKDLKAAQQSYEDAVEIATVGAEIAFEILLFLGTAGIGAAARAGRRALGAVAQRAIAAGRVTARLSQRSLSAAIAALRRAGEAFRSLGRISYRRVWRERGAARAFLGVGKGAPPPSGPVSAGLRKQAVANARSPWFRAKAEAWARATGRGRIDWDAFMSRLESAEFREFASARQALRSGGYANVTGFGEWIFGVPRALRRAPVVGDSAVQHELFHALQDMQTGLFTKGGSAASRLGRAIVAEYSAHLWGSPAIGVPAVWAPTVAGIGYLGYEGYQAVRAEE